MRTSRITLAAIVAVALVPAAIADGGSGTATATPPAPFAFGFVGRYSTGLPGNSAEIASLSGKRLYVSNADEVAVDVVDVADPAMPKLLTRVDLSGFGGSVTSVATSSELVAAAVAADPETDPGTVVVMDLDGNVLGSTTVGALPDSVVFTPDGKRILVPNEGQPSSYGEDDSVDPEGSVSIINVPRAYSPSRSSDRPPLQVRTVDFRSFNSDARREALLSDGVRIFGPGATVAQDLEPEYVTVTPDGRTAYVTLQENNALAIIDIGTARVRSIVGLGEQDHGAVPLDASDRDSGSGNAGAINIRTWDNVKGMYMPDNAAAFTIGDATYVLTANEGDAREYTGLAEEARAAAVADKSAIPGAASSAQLGRLTVTTAPPATAAAPTANGQTELYAFGSRSFSIWDSMGHQVWDSGDLLEQVTARVYPGDFNSNNDANRSFDTRSDNKGPEPEAAITGKLDGRTLAFVGLERQGGVVVTDVSDPAAPVFLQYLVTREFAGSTVGPDSGPESISFLADGPGGRPLLAVSNELTGTVGLFTTIPADGATELTLLHNNDGESSLLPQTFTPSGGGATTTFGSVGAFKTVTDREIRSARDAGRSVLNVYAGDAFLAGATLTCSDPQAATGPVFDAIAQRRIAYDAHIFGNHEFDFTPTFLDRFIRGFRTADGKLSQPFLSANLDFSGEPSWADLLDPDGLIVGEAASGRVVARSAIITDPTTTARVGIVAATTPDLPTISSPRKVVVKSADIASTAPIIQAEVDRLTALGVTKIALVSHLQSISNDVQLVGLLRNVDVAVAGGGDELLANPGDLLIPGDTAVSAYPRVVTSLTGNVPVVTTAGNYKYVGRLDVAFDAAGTATVQAGGPRRVVISSTATALPDQVTADPALVAEVHTPVQACLTTLAATPVADTEVLFDRSRTGVRSRQSNAGNLVTDAWLDSYDRYAGNVGLPARTPSVVAIQNGGGIRDNGGNFLPSNGVVGTISRLDLLNMLPFDNTMVVVSEVTPDALKQILERSASTPGGGQFLQIAGLTVTYNTSFPAQAITTAGEVTTPGQRVRSVTLSDGTAIVTDGVVQPGAPNVRIVTNNFTAGGGDNYPWLRDNPNKVVLRTAGGLAIPYELPVREYLATFPVGAGGRPSVSATDTRYAPFPSGGGNRITILTTP
jgi:YVTN family beta-propeller protein